MKNVLVIGGGKDLSKMWGGRRRRETKSQGGSGGSRPPQQNVRKKGDFTPYPRTCVPFSGTGPKNAKINP